MSSYIGEQLKRNMEVGLPTRTKRVADYTGYAMSPCGDFGTNAQSSTKPPWVSQVRNSSTPNTLHDEILEFMRYMEPTQREMALRQDLVRRFKSLIASFKINATVQPVGSYVTGLYLPTSDIDMVITFENQRSSTFISSNIYSFHKLDLQSLLYKIKASGFASKVDDVLHASVPLIRITDKMTAIQIDVTASDLHSIKATKAVHKWLANDGEIIKVLVTVVKMFLSIRNCGTTYTGGINSYVLVWMVVAWVNLEWRNTKTRMITAPKTDITSLTSAFDQMHVREISRSTLLSSANTSNIDPQKASTKASPVDYGEALMRFFKFYGCDFDYRTLSITIEPRPAYKAKIFAYTLSSVTQNYLLSIFDPAEDSIDMGSKAYGIKHIQASFEKAYARLLSAKKRYGILISHSSGGLLGCVLGGDFVKFEEKRKKFGKV